MASLGRVVRILVEFVGSVVDNVITEILVPLLLIAIGAPFVLAAHWIWAHLPAMH